MRAYSIFIAIVVLFLGCTVSCNGFDSTGVTFVTSDERYHPSGSFSSHLNIWSRYGIASLGSEVYVNGQHGNSAAFSSIYRLDENGDSLRLTSNNHSLTSPEAIRQQPGTSNIFVNQCEYKRNADGNTALEFSLYVLREDEFVDVTEEYFNASNLSSYPDLIFEACQGDWSIQSDGTLAVSSEDSIWYISSSGIILAISDLKAKMGIDTDQCKDHVIQIRSNSNDQLLLFVSSSLCYKSLPDAYSRFFIFDDGGLHAAGLSLSVDIKGVAFTGDETIYSLVQSFELSKGFINAGYRIKNKTHESFLDGINSGTSASVEGITVDHDGNVYIVHEHDRTEFTSAEWAILKFPTGNIISP